MIRPFCASFYRGRRIIPTHYSGPRRLPLYTQSPLRSSIPTYARRHTHNSTSTQTKDGTEGTKPHLTLESLPPTGTALPPTPDIQKSIPGPSWLWLEPIYTPFRAYGRVHRQRPLLTQFVSALVIYLIGDFVAQSIGGIGKEDPKASNTDDEDTREDLGALESWARDRDWSRTARSLFIGGVAAVPGYKWFLWLSNSFNYSSKIGSLALKVFINQVTFTPLFNSYFFGCQYLLSTPVSSISFDALVTHIKNTVPTSWVNSCKIWPAVTAFSFAVVPLEYRSLVAGVVAIGWQSYLSLLDARVRKAELEKLKVKEGLDGGQGVMSGSSEAVVKNRRGCEA